MSFDNVKKLHEVVKVIDYPPKKVVEMVRKPLGAPGAVEVVAEKLEKFDQGMKKLTLVHKANDKFQKDVELSDEEENALYEVGYVTLFASINRP